MDVLGILHVWSGLHQKPSQMSRVKKTFSKNLLKLQNTRVLNWLNISFYNNNNILPTTSVAQLIQIRFPIKSCRMFSYITFGTFMAGILVFWECHPYLWISLFDIHSIAYPTLRLDKLFNMNYVYWKIIYIHRYNSFSSLDILDSDGTYLLLYCWYNFFRSHINISYIMDFTDPVEFSPMLL